MVEAMLHTFVSFVFFVTMVENCNVNMIIMTLLLGIVFFAVLYKDGCCFCIKVKISGQSNPLRLPVRFSLDPETLSGIKPISSVQEQPLGK